MSEEDAEDLAVCVGRQGGREGVCCTGVQCRRQQAQPGDGAPGVPGAAAGSCRAQLGGKASVPAGSWCQTAAGRGGRGQAEPAPGTGASSTPGCAASPGAQLAPPTRPRKQCWLIRRLKRGNSLI